MTTSRPEPVGICTLDGCDAPLWDKRARYCCTNHRVAAWRRRDAALRREAADVLRQAREVLASH